MMHRKMSRGAFVVGLSLLALPVFAKAAYKDKTEMIRTSDAIAIVQISRVESASVKRGWTYRQRAFARVEKTLKGTLSGSATLYGDEDFICAQCRFAPGRYLVFLKREGGLLTGSNWQLSTRKITGSQVAWFGRDELFDVKPAELPQVLSEIRQILARQSKT